MVHCDLWLPRCVVQQGSAPDGGAGVAAQGNERQVGGRACCGASGAACAACALRQCTLVVLGWAHPRCLSMLERWCTASHTHTQAVLGSARAQLRACLPPEVWSKPAATVPLSSPQRWERSTAENTWAPAARQGAAGLRTVWVPDDSEVAACTAVTGSVGSKSAEQPQQARGRPISLRQAGGRGCKAVQEGRTDAVHGTEGPLRHGALGQDERAISLELGHLRSHSWLLRVAGQVRGQQLGSGSAGRLLHMQRGLEGGDTTHRLGQRTMVLSWRG